MSAVKVVAEIFVDPDGRPHSIEADTLQDALEFAYGKLGLRVRDFNALIMNKDNQVNSSPVLSTRLQDGDLVVLALPVWLGEPTLLESLTWKPNWAVEVS